MIPAEKSVIVVSDHHLGLKGRENIGTLFADLLRFVRTLKPKGAAGGFRIILKDGTVRELYALEKMILLGDIIDLESPKDNTRQSVLADCSPVFSTLLALDAEIVYVTGNHDNEIADMEGEFILAAAGKPEQATGSAKTTIPGGGPAKNGDRKLKIAERHYPDT